MSPGLAVAAPVLLLVTAWLSAAETVVERLPLVRALRLSDDDVPGADRLLWVMEHRTSTRNAVLVVTIAVR